MEFHVIFYCPSIEDVKSYGNIQSGTTLKIGGSQ